MDEQGSLCSASAFFMLSRREEDFAVKHQTVLGSQRASPRVCKTLGLVRISSQKRSGHETTLAAGVLCLFLLLVSSNPHSCGRSAGVSSSVTNPGEARTGRGSRRAKGRGKKRKRPDARGRDRAKRDRGTRSRVASSSTSSAERKPARAASSPFENRVSRIKKKGTNPQSTPSRKTRLEWLAALCMPKEGWC